MVHGPVEPEPPTRSGAWAAPVPSAWSLVVAGAGLIAYNIALNLVAVPGGKPVADTLAYVPVNLALAGGALAWAHRSGFHPAVLGVGRAGLRRGVALGALVAVGVAAALLGALAADPLRGLLADERVAGLGPGQIAAWALVRVPFGTALPEEIVFRAVLLAAAARRWGWLRGAAYSSAVFGLWHLGPTWVLLEANGLTGQPARAAALLLVAVALTALAGIGFCLLRRWGRHLAAPVLVHIATNSFALAAAAAVHRAGG